MTLHCSKPHLFCAKAQIAPITTFLSIRPVYSIEILEHICILSRSYSWWRPWAQPMKDDVTIIMSPLIGWAHTKIDPCWCWRRSPKISIEEDMSGSALERMMHYFRATPYWYLSSLSMHNILINALSVNIKIYPQIVDKSLDLTSILECL